MGVKQHGPHHYGRYKQTHSENKTSPLQVQAWAQLRSVRLFINTPFSMQANIQCLPSDAEHLISKRSALRWGRSILTAAHFYSRGLAVFWSRWGRLTGWCLQWWTDIRVLQRSGNISAEFKSLPVLYLLDKACHNTYVVICVLATFEH